MTKAELKERIRELEERIEKMDDSYRQLLDRNRRLRIELEHEKEDKNERCEMLRDATAFATLNWFREARGRCDRNYKAELEQKLLPLTHTTDTR